MSPQKTEVVDRMYEVLVDEIRSHRPDLLEEPFTVAEIYQNLVPYRTHRDRIGTEMNGDYEHALLRLLAGAGDYVKLESDTARRRFEEELDSVHPDTGIYRNFAACEVRLNPERLPGGAPGGMDGREDGGAAASAARPDLEEESGAEDEEDGGAGAPVPTPEESADPSDRPSSAEASTGDAVDEGAGTAEGDQGEADDETVCRWCRERLPPRNDLQFCPFCGSRVDLVPCPDCGTELEQDWLFCVACGTQVPD